MDEEQIQDTTVNEESVQDQSTSSVDEATEQVQDESTQVEQLTEEAESPANETAEPVEKPNKRGAQSRIKELLKENKELKNSQLDQLQNGKNVPIPEQVTPEEYQSLVVNGQIAQADVAQLRRELAYKDFTGELESVVNTVPELNPDSDQYNPDLEAVIAENYQDGFVQLDQNGNFVGTKKSFKEYAQKQVDVFRKAQTKGATASQEVLTRQASEQAVTSTGGGSTNPKSAEDMSLEELESKLKIVRH